MGCGPQGHKDSDVTEQLAPLLPHILLSTRGEGFRAAWQEDQDFLVETWGLSYRTGPGPSILKRETPSSVTQEGLNLQKEYKLSEITPDNLKIQMYLFMKKTKWSLPN